MTAPATVRSPYRLLVLALACQASISIVQWGLGVIAPDLQSRYGLSAAGLGALVNATALGNAVALIVAGVIVDRSGPRIPLLFAGSASGLLLIGGSLLTNPFGLGIALFASGVAGAVVAVAATVSVFYGFPPERRGFALGMRQMSVALGGLLAALLLPLAVHVGGVRLALGLSGVLTAITAVAFALYTPHGPLVPPDRLRGASWRRSRCSGRRACPACWWLRVCYIVALAAVLTFGVPALRDGGASQGRRQPAVRVREPECDGRAHRLGAARRLRRRPAARRHAARRRHLRLRRRPAHVGRLAPRHRRPHRGARRAQPRRARVQRRALRDRRRDRGRRARRARPSR